jgi:hypothetical protein
LYNKIDNEVEWGREIYTSKHGSIKFFEIVMPYPVVGVAFINPWCFEIL